MVDAINNFTSGMIKNHPVIYVVLLMLFIFGIGYALYRFVFSRYADFLAENYGFRLFGFWGKLMLGCVLLYTFVLHFVMPGITVGWDWLSLVDVTEFGASARAMLLILPLTAVYFFVALRKIKSVGHAAGATLTMYAAAIIGGFLGTIAGMMIVFTIGLYAILCPFGTSFKKSNTASGYKCHVCGDVVQSDGRCSCGRVDTY